MVLLTPLLMMMGSRSTVMPRGYLFLMLLSFMQSSWSTDGYSGSSPQRHLHKRIAFCLQLHTETVKAMQYADTSMVSCRGRTGDLLITLYFSTSAEEQQQRK